MLTLRFSPSLAGLYIVTVLAAFNAWIPKARGTSSLPQRLRIRSFQHDCRVHAEFLKVSYRDLDDHSQVSWVLQVSNKIKDCPLLENIQSGDSIQLRIPGAMYSTAIRDVVYPNSVPMPPAEGTMVSLRIIRSDFGFEIESWDTDFKIE